jgi:uncharacterized protein YfaT (DUF1175 family)
MKRSFWHWLEDWIGDPLPEAERHRFSRQVESKLQGKIDVERAVVVHDGKVLESPTSSKLHTFAYVPVISSARKNGPVAAFLKVEYSTLSRFGLGECLRSNDHE